MGGLTTGGALTLVVLAILYFVPALLALGRNHPNSVAIFLVNLVFGWSLLGWFVALIWAVKAIDRPAMAVEEYIEPEPEAPRRLSLSFTLSQDLYGGLAVMAQLTGLSLAELGRRAVAEYLAAHAAESAPAPKSPARPEPTGGDSRSAPLTASDDDRLR